MTKSPTLGVLIGRFQFFHYGHLDAIRQALERVDRLVVLVGSANRPRSFYNPLTAEERSGVIHAAVREMLGSDAAARISTVAVDDCAYDDVGWIGEVQLAVGSELVHLGLPPETRVLLTGHRKDGTSYYLNMFPDWGEVALEDRTGLSSTGIRRAFFATDGRYLSADEVPPATAADAYRFADSHAFTLLQREYRFAERYREPYKALPYPPTFTTVDACVVQAGHVLMVRRGAMPYEGLWALPGGFLDVTHSLDDWTIQELVQETNIRVPEPVLRGSVRRREVYDGVHRDPRGRFISHCTLFVLSPSPRAGGGRTPLPRVRGGDDAVPGRRGARWFPLYGPGALDPEQTAFDHYDIIRHIVAAGRSQPGADF